MNGTGTVLFNPRSKELRLRIEMPCSGTAHVREKRRLGAKFNFQDNISERSGKKRT
jgi:hypothetical protein